jgi:hypothetical protein
MKNWPFALWGGDGSDESDGDEGSASEEEPELITMTREEVDAIAAKAASRATRKANKSFVSDMGFASQDEMRSYLGAAREREASEATEAERIQQELESERASLASDRLSVAAERIGLTIDRSIILAGVTDEAKSKRIHTLVRAELGNDVEVDEGLFDDVADALGKIQADLPDLFAPSGKRSFGSSDAGADDHDVDDEEKRRQEREAGWEKEYRSRGAVYSP